MIYFLVLPLWLLGLLGCGVLALFRPLRVLSAYLALAGTLGVWMSFALSTGAIFVPSLLHMEEGSQAGAAVFIGGYLAGMAGGGLLGAVLGLLLAHRLTRGRPIIPGRN